MSDLEGNIYEPWIRWKSENQSKSDSDNMQGPVIPEGEEAKGLKEGQEMVKLLIIGKTGTGKSSLCNKIAGYPVIADVFPVSSNVTSCSQSTQFGNIKFNGNSERIMSLIDTIGFDDPDEKTGGIDNFIVSNWKIKHVFADVERDAFTEGIDTFNVPNVMKEVDFQQLVENTGLKMNHDQESSSPSAFQSITKETFYQYMISLLLCYQVMFDCWITKNIMIVPQALKDLENKVVITLFPLLFLFSILILESWIQLNRKNPDRMQWGNHASKHDTSNQKIYILKPESWFTGRVWVCSRVTRHFLLPPNFNEAIRLSEPLPNEYNSLQKKRRIKTNKKKEDNTLQKK